jgi:hypothetical protein
LNREMFLSARACGRQRYCADRARATPSHRRVVCVLANINGVANPSYSCAGAMFYDGTAIDFTTSMDMAGVLFSFRDTAWEEKSFEIERRLYGANHENEKFDTVVLIEGDLKGCAAKFSSITYFDRDASITPNSEWLYRVTTKIPESNDASALSYHISSGLAFKTPWMSQILGRVLAGASTEGVRNVRICAEFDTFIQHQATSETFNDELSKLENLAQYKRVSHSDIKASGSAYVLTDGEVSTGDSATVDANEYVRVNLGSWSSVETIDVCIASSSATRPSLATYVQDYDPGHSGNHGNECVYVSTYLVDGVQNRACSSYACKGTSVKSFHGQYVTVKAIESINFPEKIYEVKALGESTRCKYTDVTGKDGDYEMILQDTSGQVPVKAMLHIGAYKEEKFPEKLTLIHI